MAQFTLDLPHTPVYHADNFTVSDCNREAHGWIMRWPDWPSYGLYMYGDPGSGKSHLAHIWASRAKAGGAPAHAGELAAHALLENVETYGEEALLHLLNTAKENGFSLLLTSRLAAKALPFRLPDLTSRLLALPAVHILPPDDDAIMGAMRKQFADRQLVVEEEVLAYLLPRMERSFQQVSELVRRLDGEALSQGRRITVPFVRQLLDR